MTGRRLILGNADVRISYARAGKTSPLYRNATGDECVYVESGAAVVETVFGSLPVAQGDYVIIPRATNHRWVVQAGDTAGSTHRGQRPHRPGPAVPVQTRPAPGARAVLRARPARPRAAAAGRGQDVTVYVKHRGAGPDGLAAPSTPAGPTPSTSSAGTAASTRTRSTSTTSSPSPARSTSRRRCTRPSRATTS